MRKMDYTQFGDKQPLEEGQYYTKKWWKAPKDERAQAVCSTLKSLSEYDGRRQTQYQISTRLYGNLNLMGLNGLSYSKIASVQNSLKDRISYNLVQSVIDTVTAKIGKNKPKPLFLTSGGNYEMQRKAKKLDKFVSGTFYENNSFDLGLDIFRDSCVFGDGLVHVYNHYGRVKHERVIASELYADWVDSFYGEPRQLHRAKNVDREVLIDHFPDKKRLIQESSSASADLIGTYQNVADQITVIESWHLPSGPDANDGIHTINLANGNLLDEKWQKDFFPFAKLSWSKRLYGYYGQGLAEQLQNIQLEINKILWVIQRSMHLAGSFKILMENGSKIVKEHFNNDIGAIICYTGAPPQYIVPQIVSAELYTHLQTLIRQGYEQSGVSQLSAASQKPAGLNSGKALREYNDIESDRQLTNGKAYEKFFMDLSKLSISVAKEIKEEKGSYQVQVPGKRFFDSIDWKHINLSEDQYIMQCYPVSSLPDEPAGRLQTITEYMQAGIMSPRVGRKLLDFPDLEQEETLANSQEEYLQMILDQIVDEGIYTPPDPLDDLVMAREMALEYYSEGKKGKLEPEKLNLIETFLSQLDTLNEKAMPPTIQGGGTPQANPQSPPTSELIPNVPGIQAAA